MNTYSITTTLPYVNADPHIGFALEIVQADMLARYHKERGFDVVFNTGTDEHGQKIYQKAQEAGMDPKAYCDEYAAKFDGLKSALNLTYNHFIRTTDEHHVAAAQAFWTKCFEAGDIYKKQYSVKYCVGCELEKTDSELVEGRCPIHPNRELDLIEEENYFFTFSKYQEKLLALYSERPDFVMPRERMNEIRTFVEGGLNDFSISRLKSKMPWGIPVPNDADHVMYVWFDALVNYISTLGWPDESGEFATAWPMVQVAGKDNLRQQSAMWQAMLMSVGIAPSKQVFIHGYITADGQKMSKSIGNVINPYDLVAEYGTDATRMYLLGGIPSWQDGDYSKEQFEILFASKLANGIGNLVSRVAAMANKSFATGLDRIEFTSGVRNSNQLEVAIKNYDFKKYVDIVWSVIDEANEKIEKESPFRVVKTDEATAKKTLSELAGMIRWIGEALKPVIPTTADEITRRYASDIIEVGPALFPRRESKSD
ncbi:MAG: methionine--tRNA ligase [Candidatus Uhrbacteria bacterium]|nr:methionine--tRNA ligase [Candidatus Uhrbacteria bacterium]